MYIYVADFFFLYLLQMLLLDDSDNYCTFSDSDRDEFLFQLFKFVCLGGEICQYEDNVDAYLNITKQIYKDLIGYSLNLIIAYLNNWFMTHIQSTTLAWHQSCHRISSRVNVMYSDVGSDFDLSAYFHEQCC